MRNDKRRFIDLLNNIRHRKCLTRSGDTKQCLALISFFKASDQILDCLRLVTGRLVL